MIILAIETSCDETAVAVARFQRRKLEVLSNVVASQIKLHQRFGGVVPQLAARAHLHNLPTVLARAVKTAKVNPAQIDYLAFTQGPGLIPALLVGVNAARALGLAWDKPLLPINHLEGHIYANRLEKTGGKTYDLAPIHYPALALIVSGGHTQLVLMEAPGKLRIIGETLDDAAGEAFDKVAKILGLDYPGGPLLEKLAVRARADRFAFPRPMLNSKDFNFSFSGLKTAVLYEKMRYVTLTPKMKADFAASFQAAAVNVLVHKTLRAAEKFGAKEIMLGGGVAANRMLLKTLVRSSEERAVAADIYYPPKNLTTDNALMIAVAAHFNLAAGKKPISWREAKAQSNLRLK